MRIRLLCVLVGLTSLSPLLAMEPPNLAGDWHCMLKGRMLRWTPGFGEIGRIHGVFYLSRT
jgi:hypothetical protein